jgi:hypothetical protein
VLLRLMKLENAGHDVFCSFTELARAALLSAECLSAREASENKA